MGEKLRKRSQGIWAPPLVPASFGTSLFVHTTLGPPGGLPWLRGHVGGVAVWGPARLPPPQPQHSHLVIQQLLSHLDANSRSAATVRAGIVEVLSEAAVIAATGSVGKGGS